MSDIIPLHDFIEHAPIPIIRIDAQGTIHQINHSFSLLTDHHIESQTHSLFDFLSEDDRAACHEQLNALLKEGTPHSASLPLEIILPNRKVTALTHMTTFSAPEAESAHVILHLIDQSEQKNLEMRFAHSQKMQAVGQLAGGVAHDFNNLLTAMIGFSDLLLMRHPAGDPSFADIMQIKQNANRAANLVRQLLAFSRRQTLQPKILDLTDVLAELSNLLRRLIGENIELKMQHGRDIGNIKADQGQLEQVIINLVVNARDAMKEGGSLGIITSHVNVTPENTPKAPWYSPTEDEQITPGPYVQIDITDTGHGIPYDILDKIFEPFFSTKEIGSGTGLGLATVYGIIKQTEGYLFVQSKEQAGTTFRIFFKAYADEKRMQSSASNEDHKAPDLTGQEVILLVEDEAPVRTFAARALSNKGYQVLEAESGEHAIEVLKQHDGKIDVLVSDVIMPGINGPTMLETMERDYPALIKDTKVIFISGYAEDAFADSFTEKREFNFLPKPFTLKQLASKVKDVTQS